MELLHKYRCQLLYNFNVDSAYSIIVYGKLLQNIRTQLARYHKVAIGLTNLTMPNQLFGLFYISGAVK